MKNADSPKPANTPAENRATSWWREGAGWFVLALLAAYLLRVSWRKWADPIVDSGAQWYAFWRMSQGAVLYHDILWNYGPLSAFFNASLFRVFGPGMMVLAAANLVIYGFIVTLAYVAFRRAWGRLAAFAATAVFICAFSFLHLSGIGNYNYVLPYAHESTHGMLLALVTVFVAVRWQREASVRVAFGLGLCGGIAAVLKPEFMLACGVVGIAAFVLRFAGRKRITAKEFASLAVGLMLPTLLFTAWFARREAPGSAFIDASRAWWMVLVDHSQLSSQQAKFAGLGHAGANVLIQLESAGQALGTFALIWVAGWCTNRRWTPVVRIAVATASLAVIWFLTPRGGWYAVARCFPILVAATAVIIVMRGLREWRASGKLEERTVMALMLVLLAGTMLARMPLFPRIYHLGFFQAAFAGMVLSAFMVAELPCWTGASVWGRRVAAGSALAVLATGCFAITQRSALVYADADYLVGSGAERFYAFPPDIDATGALVNWTVQQVLTMPPQATVMVLSEGLMINYLSRHVSPLPTWNGTVPEDVYIKQLQSASPDYFVLISRDLSEHTEKRFGKEGKPGGQIVKWVIANYRPIKGVGGDPLDPAGQKGALILQRK